MPEGGRQSPARDWNNRGLMGPGEVSWSCECHTTHPNSLLPFPGGSSSQEPPKRRFPRALQKRCALRRCMSLRTKPVIPPPVLCRLNAHPPVHDHHPFVVANVRRTDQVTHSGWQPRKQSIEVLPRRGYGYKPNVDELPASLRWVSEGIKFTPKEFWRSGCRGPKAPWQAPAESSVDRRSHATRST
jgi:hypothetical protein